MNKAEVIQTIQSAPKELIDEINFFLDTYSDDPEYNIIDAFDDASSGAEDNHDIKMFNICKSIYIKIGYCVPVDITHVYVTSGRKYWFKLSGVYYDCVTNWQKFVDSLI